MGKWPLRWHRPQAARQAPALPPTPQLASAGGRTRCQTAPEGFTCAPLCHRMMPKPAPGPAMSLPADQAPPQSLCRTKARQSLDTHDNTGLCRVKRDLIYHQLPHSSQIRGVVFQEINQTARRGDANLSTASQITGLGTARSTAIATHGLERQPAPDLSATCTPDDRVGAIGAWTSGGGGHLPYCSSRQSCRPAPSVCIGRKTPRIAPNDPIGISRWAYTVPNVPRRVHMCSPLSPNDAQAPGGATTTG